jgi:hypothetical protein
LLIAEYLQRGIGRSQVCRWRCHLCQCRGQQFPELDHLESRIASHAKQTLSSMESLSQAAKKDAPVIDIACCH